MSDQTFGEKVNRLLDASDLERIGKLHAEFTIAMSGNYSNDHCFSLAFCLAEEVPGMLSHIKRMEKELAEAKQSLAEWTFPDLPRAEVLP